MTKQFFIDIETNQSLDPKTGIITQLAGIIRIDNTIREKINFKDNIYGNFKNVLDKYIDKFNPKDKFFFIGYNSKFDTDFIRELFLKNKDNYYGSYFYNPSIDVMNIAAYRFMIKSIHPENFKLSTVCKHLGIKITDSKLHDASYDIEKTYNLYLKLRKL